MTVYNDEEHIEETIESVLNQTYDNFEFIIVNDGSTDNTEKIIRSFDDERIKYYFPSKLGRAKALNYALNKSSGKYIANIDSDDPSSKKRLEKQVEFLNLNKKIVLLGTSSILIDSSGKILNKKSKEYNNQKIIKMLGRTNPFNHSSVMYRKVEILKIGGYDENLNAQIDYNLWIRIANNYKMHIISDLLAYKRIHENQFFEGDLIKKNYLKLKKNQVYAIKSLNLSKINYFMMLLSIFKNIIPKKLKIKLKSLMYNFKGE